MQYAHASLLYYANWVILNYKATRDVNGLYTLSGEAEGIGCAVCGEKSVAVLLLSAQEACSEKTPSTARKTTANCKHVVHHIIGIVSVCVCRR